MIQIWTYLKKFKFSEKEEEQKNYFESCFKFVQDNDAWRVHDYSRENSMSARRARSLAIPESRGDIVWTKEIYDKHHFMVEDLKTVDFSFNYTESLTGQW